MSNVDFTDSSKSRALDGRGDQHGLATQPHRDALLAGVKGSGGGYILRVTSAANIVSKNRAVAAGAGLRR